MRVASIKSGHNSFEAAQVFIFRISLVPCGDKVLFPSPTELMVTLPGFCLPNNRRSRCERVAAISGSPIRIQELLASFLYTERAAQRPDAIAGCLIRVLHPQSHSSAATPPLKL